MRNRNVVLSAAGAEPPIYVEDVFSTYLYNGYTVSPNTITNGIDLAGKGGLVWIKGRNQTYGHYLTHEATKGLQTNTTGAQFTNSSGISSFTSTGFTTGGEGTVGGNGSADTFVSWTFRKQKKFFDVVTYTGNDFGFTGGITRNIPHNLGSTPGMIIVKNLSTNNTEWQVWHRENTSSYSNLWLNSNIANSFDFINDGFIDNVNNTTFAVSAGAGSQYNVNYAGNNYVAYLFAHNAGGFGTSGTDNVISCGSFAISGSNVTTDLGYEPQYLLVKRTTSLRDWEVVDNMRNFGVSSSTVLYPNLDGGDALDSKILLTSTGFTTTASLGNGTYIYMAIRRGPMKVPTSGTSVFSPTFNSGTGTNKTITTNFPVDFTIMSAMSAAVHVFSDRLRGGGIDLSPRVYSQSTSAEDNTFGGRGVLFDNNTGFTLTSNYNNGSGDNYIYYGFRRAPGFFDEVCYTGTGTSYRQLNHNLTVAPEMIFLKKRNSTSNWFVYGAGNAGAISSYDLALNLTSSISSNSVFASSTYQTSSLFTLGGTPSNCNNTNDTYVAYLFATCPGVSKVGSYTGTGTTNQINCGFTNGARFVLIKRTDSTGDWYTWDSARGIIAGNDPYLLMNSTAAEVTNTDYIDPYSAGFELSSTAPAALNANGGTYIFLAIA